VDLTLKSQRFRMEREARWRQLETLLDRFERRRWSSLTDDEIIALPLLYRAVLSSLSLARSISLDKNLVSYLESLGTRAYFCVYGTRRTLGERVAHFFARDWYKAVRALWRETLAAALLTLLGIVVAFVLVEQSPMWFSAFVPDSLAEGRNPDASFRDLHDTLFGGHGADGLTVFSTFLFTHNAQIALLAFALGFACCVPTALLMLYNGFALGALFAVFVQHGLGIEFGGWVLIHGTTEILAVILAGAAGFRLGWTLAFPGEQSRGDAMAAAGRLAALVMAGVVVMLAVAGVLEGFGRQLIENTPLRYLIAFGSAAFWLAYFYAPRRSP